MPQFRRLNQEEIQEIVSKPSGRSPIDLSEYVGFLKELQVGDYGEIEMEEDKNTPAERKTTKRRMTTAAGTLNLELRYLRNENNSPKIQFEVKAAVDPAVTAPTTTTAPETPTEPVAATNEQEATEAPSNGRTRRQTAGAAA
jgi:hypothetical protein